MVPVKTLEERIAAVSFGGDRAALSPEDASKLSFVANFAIGRFLQLHAAAGRSPARLTARERECLLWSSEGKTEADIGDILGVSTSTISKHIAAARDRLGAINKAHAVAVAMKLNIV